MNKIYQQGVMENRFIGYWADEFRLSWQDERVRKRLLQILSCPYDNRRYLAIQ